MPHLPRSKSSWSSISYFSDTTSLCLCHQLLNISNYLTTTFSFCSSISQFFWNYSSLAQVSQLVIVQAELFTDWMPLLSLSQQCQSTKWWLIHSLPTNSNLVIKQGSSWHTLACHPASHLWLHHPVLVCVSRRWWWWQWGQLFQYRYQWMATEVLACLQQQATHLIARNFNASQSQLNVKRCP